MGKKKQPHYRIVVADSRSPRDGRFVERLGYYNPLTHPARLRIDLERVDYWLSEGAITSNTVGNLVDKARAGGDKTVMLVDGSVEGANGKTAKAAQPTASEDSSADATANEPTSEEVAEPKSEASPDDKKEDPTADTDSDDTGAAEVDSGEADVTESAK